MGGTATCEKMWPGKDWRKGAEEREPNVALSDGFDYMSMGWEWR